jgi:hypothetical protein
MERKNRGKKCPNNYIHCSIYICTYLEYWAVEKLGCKVQFMIFSVYEYLEYFFYFCHFLHLDFYGLTPAIVETIGAIRIVHDHGKFSAIDTFFSFLRHR